MGYNLSIEGAQKEYLFCPKWHTKTKGKGSDTLYKSLWSAPPITVASHRSPSMKGGRIRILKYFLIKIHT